MKSHGSLLVLLTRISTSWPWSASTLPSAEAAAGSQSHSLAKCDTSMRYGLPFTADSRASDAGWCRRSAVTYTSALLARTSSNSESPAPPQTAIAPYQAVLVAGNADSPGYGRQDAENARGEIAQAHDLGEITHAANAFFREPVRGDGQRRNILQSQRIGQDIRNATDGGIAVGVDGQQRRTRLDEPVDCLALGGGGSHRRDPLEQQRDGA